MFLTTIHWGCISHLRSINQGSCAWFIPTMLWTTIHWSCVSHLRSINQGSCTWFVPTMLLITIHWNYASHLRSINLGSSTQFIPNKVIPKIPIHDYLRPSRIEDNLLRLHIIFEPISEVRTHKQASRQFMSVRDFSTIKRINECWGAMSTDHTHYIIYNP